LRIAMLEEAIDNTSCADAGSVHHRCGEQSEGEPTELRIEVVHRPYPPSRGQRAEEQAVTAGQPEMSALWLRPLRCASHLADSIGESVNRTGDQSGDLVVLLRYLV